MIIVINKKEVSFIERDGGIFTDSLAISEVFEKIESKKHLFYGTNFRSDKYTDRKGERR